MSTTVIGIGDRVAKNKKDMEEVAGKEGRVFLFPDFDELNKRLNAMLGAACGRLVYCELNYVSWCNVMLIWQVGLL